MFSIAATATSAAHAEESSAPPSESVRLEQVRVTAAPAEQPLVTTIDAKAPAQPLPAQDGADYLKTVPGFSAVRKAGIDGDPVLRGQAGSRLAVLLDGQAIFGGCGARMDPPTAYVFPSAYDTITVIKGPQSVRYGPGTTAGVVLFERETERFEEPGVRAQGAVTFASFQRREEAGEIVVGRPEAYVRASGNYSESGDYADGDGNRVHSFYHRWAANAAVGWTPDEHTRLEISGAKSDGNAAYADRAIDGSKFARDNLGVRFKKHAVSPLITALDASVYYNYADHVMDNFSLRPAPMMRMLMNPDRLTLGGRVEGTLSLSEAASSIVGADYQANRHRGRMSLSTPQVKDAEFADIGVFSETTVKLGQRTRVIAGARYDHWTARDKRQMLSVGSGMMGAMVMNPTAGKERSSDLVGGFGRVEGDLSALPVTLYAGAGITRRFPDYWELIGKENAGTLSSFNTRPETAGQLDLGALLKRGSVSASVSVFANRTDDYILVQKNVLKPGIPMGTRFATIVRNIDASTFGGEASASWEFAQGWRAESSVSYVRGENRTDHRPLAQQPPLEGRLGLRYSTPVWTLGGLVRAVAAQHRFAVDQGNIVGQDIGPTPGFAVLSLNAGWRFSRYAQLSLGVDNLLDTTYAEFISRAGSDLAGFVTTTRVNEPGRTIWAKLSLSY